MVVKKGEKLKNALAVPVIGANIQFGNS